MTTPYEEISTVRTARKRRFCTCSCARPIERKERYFYHFWRTADGWPMFAWYRIECATRLGYIAPVISE